MALAAIYQGIPEVMLLSLAEKETAKETWTTLKTTYMGADRVKTARVQTLKAEFKFGDLYHMSVEEVVGRLKTYEERIKGHVEADEKKLFLTHQEWFERNKKQSEDDSKSGNKNYRGSSSNSRGRGRGRGRGNWSGNQGGRGRGGGNQQRDGYRGSDKNQDKSKVQCYNCQQYGHYAAECRNPRRERNQEANLTQENNDGEPALLLSTFDEDDRVQEVFLNEENVNPRLKSATNVGSNHMTGYKDKFRELDRSIHGSVKFRDGSKVRIEGKGSILFKCKNGEHRLLQEVYFIPRLCSNIISLGQLAEGDDQIIMHGSFLWVHDVKGKLLMKVRRSPNRLYKIQLEKVKSRCLLGKSDEEVKLWHTRMGHVNYVELKLMSDKEMVQGLPKITNQNGLCEGCLEGKQARKSFSTHSNFMSTRRLELVHGDLCGPISPPIPTRNREMKPNRNGDGKKYYERDESTRLFMGEAVRNAVYVLNRVTIKSLHNSTPYQMWTGRKPSIGMKAYRLFDPDTGRIRVTRDVLFNEERPWQWGKSEKFKGTPGATLTLEGFIPQDNREDDDMESPTGLEFLAQGTDEHYKTNLEDEPVTLISSVGSAGSTSSLTRGGAPKRYRTLTDLYDETNEVLLLNDGEEPTSPTSYSMAYKHEEWKEAMKTELDSIERNNTWTLVYALVARIETVRILLAFLSKNGCFIHHLDVKFAFLNGELEDEVYVVQPEGYEKKDQPGKVYKLSKALYGLRQAPRAWNLRLDRCLKQLGFKRCLLISRFMEKPTAQHLKAVNYILIYVKGTVNYGIVYTKGSGEDIIIGYMDSNFARDVNDRRSTRGMVFYLNNNLVTWGSQKQHCVALFSCEAEFMAATTATCQAIWIKRLLSKITGREIKPPMLFIDNKSTLDLAKNPVFHGRSKHIDTKFHFIRECVEKGEITVQHVCSKEQRAHILTKSMAKHQFEDMRSLLGVKELLNSRLKGKLLKC
uniref:CCHC-type domain-containing protein n=1 Tax=Tanacetum cinerariifolium TaxID=118510 RepID=A0A699IHB5_TANCI|nr:hypothetical protein [Tanacetum cinerariifolium]